MGYDREHSHLTQPLITPLKLVDPESAFGTGRRIKQTGSICPECTARVIADVYERNGQVWMDKSCPAHGEYSALLSSGTAHYYEQKIELPGAPACCANGCGVPASGEEAVASSPAWANHSCNILIEITERCNLTCPTCFAGSSPHHSRMMSVDDFTRQVDQLVAGGKANTDVIQLSGGEPTVHPELMTMVDILIDRGFLNVCINSNGIKMAQRRFTERLASCVEGTEARLFAYLQFDGFEKETYAALRGREDLLDIKRKALENCLDNGISVHPVMTLTRDLNDHEIGRFIDLAHDYRQIRNVVIQPAMYSGRYENPRRVDRLTLEETVTMICRQFEAFSPQDFTPIPCSDPNCFSMAAALRTRNGLLPISRYFPPYRDWASDSNAPLISSLSDSINGPMAMAEAVKWMAAGDQLADIDDAVVEELLDSMIEWQNMDAKQVGHALWDGLLTVSIKPFMDAYTYDQDRIDTCCVHILDAAGQPVSFCEYNAINRPREAKRKAIGNGAPM